MQEIFVNIKKSNTERSQPKLNNDILQSPYVKKYVGKKRNIAIILLILCIACLGYGGGIGFNNVKELTTSYEPIQVTATDEFTERQAVGTRKNRRMVDVRVVGVELPDGSNGKVRSDTIKVGDQATVLQSSANGNLYEKEPSNPGILEWVISLGVLGLGILFLYIALSPIGKIRAVRKASTGDNPQLELEITQFENQAVTDFQVQYPAIVKNSGFAQLPVGTPLDIFIDRQSFVPELQNPVHVSVLKSEGEEYAVILAIKAKDQWYIGYGETELAKAKRLEASGVNQ